MKRAAILLYILSSCLGLIAQSGTFVKGVVLDALNKTPLPYVALFFEGTSQGDLSNSGGEFIIEATDDVVRQRKLKVMFTGYHSQEIQLNTDSIQTVTIYLMPVAHKDDIAILEAIRIMGDEGRKPLPYYL